MGYAVGGLILGYLAESLSVIVSVIFSGIATLIVALLFMVFYEDVQEKSVDLSN